MRGPAHRPSPTYPPTYAPSYSPPRPPRQKRDHDEWLGWGRSGGSAVVPVQVQSVMGRGRFAGQAAGTQGEASNGRLSRDEGRHLRRPGEAGRPVDSGDMRRPPSHCDAAGDAPRPWRHRPKNPGRPARREPLTIACGLPLGANTPPARASSPAPGDGSVNNPKARAWRTPGRARRVRHSLSPSSRSMSPSLPSETSPVFE